MGIIEFKHGFVFLYIKTSIYGRRALLGFTKDSDATHLHLFYIRMTWMH